MTLTLLHCDKVCVCTQDAHITAAPITFDLLALIVSGHNGLNGSREINAAGRLGVARLVPSQPYANGASGGGDFQTNAGRSNDKAVVGGRDGGVGIGARRLLVADRGYARRR